MPDQVDRVVDHQVRRCAVVTTVRLEDMGPAQVNLRAHSHSIVPGGLLVMSRVTRLTSGTSLVIRVEIVSSTS